MSGLSYFPSFSEGLSLRVACLNSFSAHEDEDFPSFSEGLSLRGGAPGDLAKRGTFPFLFGGTFIEGFSLSWVCFGLRPFPFLFGGTFIEGLSARLLWRMFLYFPSFSEGLSLRERQLAHLRRHVHHFPSFSEGLSLRATVETTFCPTSRPFPFLFGGTFIEGRGFPAPPARAFNFPSFSEGLSLRDPDVDLCVGEGGISLPFRRDFH